MLRIAKVRTGSFVDGPDGPRTVVWFAGCSIRCDGCQNAHLWAENSGIPLPPESAAQQILRTSGDEPLTLTGGEPFDQVEALHEFMVAVRKLSYERHVICYSGYTVEQLVERWRNSWGRGGDKADQLIGEILHMLDVLVDGPYIARLDSDHMQWRGSSNQRPIDLRRSIIAGLLALDLDVHKTIRKLDWDTPVLQISGGNIIVTGGTADIMRVRELGKLKEIALCGEAGKNGTPPKDQADSIQEQR
jgi:anaerobic ribonucleoside-triphosphate reductase activating protein